MTQAFTPQLVSLSEGPNIAFDKPILFVGRQAECDVQIDSRKISRRHCCIAVVDDHLVVRDLGSTNGVRINGVRVIEGNLQIDDELSIGDMRYQVKVATPGKGKVKMSKKKAIAVDNMAAAALLDDDQSCTVPTPTATDGAMSPLSPESSTENHQANNGEADDPFAPYLSDDIALAPLEPPES